ncbi:hypothetical protein C8R43DRAFT_832950, partial [Mycena crocata]
YFTMTREAAVFVAERFKAIFPTFYQEYKADFEAGRWLHEIREDPGPFLGRAIVYKLQILVHRDHLDHGPSVTFPAGYFSGGAMYFPDLDAKFAYRPGDLCISLSADLYHAVEPWSPIPCPPDVSKGQITPGRVATVFFHPDKSSLTLHGKRPDWATETAGGTLPD